MTTTTDTMSTTIVIAISVAIGFVLERIYNAFNREATYWWKIFQDWRHEDKTMKVENDKAIAVHKKISDTKDRLSRSTKHGQRFLICREHRRVLPD